jgi:signal transduction histidine kinase
MNTPVHILVVDDIPQNLVATEALLAREGVTVLKAGCGREALELLLVHEVALGLIDVNMPDMSGFELAELIRGSERTRGTPLIFMTAAAPEKGFTFRGYEAGAVDFLFKPVDPPVLRSKVKVFVELYQQRKQMAQQLDELKRALDLNEKFTAVLGHDLRTPLSVVMNGAMLLPMMTDHPKVAVTAQRIQSSARRMGQMVDQLLDLARIRSGRLKLALQEHDVGALCRLLVDENDPARTAVNGDGDMRARVDAAILTQALSHLLANALQHGEPEHLVRVHLDGSAPADIAIHLSNHGAIPNERLPRIFEPFQHGPEARKAGQGLGLGLYTASMYIKAHGGKIGVVSDSERGTTVFTITLPRQVAA